MSIQLFIEMPGGDKVVDTTKKIEDGLDRSAEAANRARDAAGRFAKTAADAGDAAARGGEKAAAGHDKARAAAEGHGDALSNVIHAVEAYLAIHQFEQVVDGYVEVRNKINAVSESQQNLAGLLDETFRIAQETRTEWEGLASTYQRVSNAGRSLGISQRQVLDLTEELAMGLRLSGSSSREAMMTMMELTHAFTVGTLTGREFRVMMKDAPALMHELQVVSGKTGAEFAEMGKHGHLTAQLLIDWFGKAKDTIRDKFGQTIPTVAEDLQIVRNAAERFFGEAAVGSGAMTALANAAKYVAQHFDGIAKVALAVGEALLGLFVIEKIIALVRALTVAVAANPLGAILTALTVGISLLRQFGDELTTHERIWSNVDDQFLIVGDHLRALWSMFLDLGAAILTFVDTAWHALMAAFSGGIDTTGIELSLRNVLLFLASFVDAAVGIFTLFKDTIVNVFGGIPVLIADVVVEAARKVVAGVEWLVNKVIAGINKLIDAKNAVAEHMPGKDTQAETEAAFRKEITRQAQAAGMRPSDFGIAPRTIYEPPTFPGGKIDPDWVRSPGSYRHDVGIGEPGTEAEVLPLNQQALAFAKQRGIAVPQLGTPHVAPIDLDFTNPFAGAGSAFLQKLKGDWNDDLHNTNVTKDLVSSFMDELDKRAHDEAAKRVMGARGPGTVNDARGLADAHVPDEKELKALEKLRNELRTVLEASNPVTAAQEKLAHAQDIVNQAVDKGLIGWAQGAAAMENYRRKEADALDPVGAWTRKQIEAGAALRDTAQEQEHAAAVLAFETEMKKAGVVVTEQQIAAAGHLLTVQKQHTEQMRAEQQILESLTGPAHEYQLALQAAGDLLERGRIHAEQYGQAVDKIRAAYLAAKPGAKSFMDGLEAGWLQMKQDAQDFGASVAKLVIDDFGKLNDAIVTAANGGAVAWGQMADAMIQDLERIALKMLEVKLIEAGLGLFGGGGDGALVPGVNAPVTSPSQIARTMPVAYPTPAAAGAASSAPVADSARVVVHVHNHYDTSVAHAANDTRRGQTQILNVLRANPSALRSRTGANRG